MYESYGKKIENPISSFQLQVFPTYTLTYITLKFLYLLVTLAFNEVFQYFQFFSNHPF